MEGDFNNVQCFFASENVNEIVKKKKTHETNTTHTHTNHIDATRATHMTHTHATPTHVHTTHTNARTQICSHSPILTLRHAHAHLQVLECTSSCVILTHTCS